MPLPLVSRLRPLKRRGTAEDRSVDLLPIGVALAVTLVAAAGLAAVLLLGAFAWLGPPAVGPGGVGLTALLDIIKIALAVVGGIGGAVALVVAYRRQRLAEEDNLRARQAARRDDTKLFNERFTTATGQLGNDSAAVRLAGVHALAALADDWAGGRQMCIDVMCAYLRLPQRPEPGPGGAPTLTPPGRPWARSAPPSGA
ncbi:hypothetical protein ABGB17_20705 [Sphaerisporangium sp. B11E5]|uniref:hypothetical protein n=1 Tax=Sphaerisporangium sp. B11E5 TaxID=3153563 RepID=UPI00325CEE7A